MMIWDGPRYGRVPAGLGKERCTWICGMFIVGWDGVNCVREGK